MPGYIAQNRDPFRALIRRFPKQFRCTVSAFWTEALMRANWERRENTYGRDAVMLERGQFVMGRDEISEFLGVSPRTIRTILNKLFTISELTSRTTNRGSVLTIVNFDSYVCVNNKNDQQNDQEETRKRPGRDHSRESREVKEVDQNLKTMAETEGVSAVSLPEEELFPVSDNGKTKTVDIGAIAAHYNAKIHDKARLIDKARDKIRVRLNTYAKEDLIRAMDNFSADPWWMENNSRHGMAWFFRSDEHIERFLNLIPRKAAASNPLLCPEHGPMERSNVNGNIVYFCKQFRNGCPNVYRSEVVWTDKLQAWEMGNRV